MASFNIRQYSSIYKKFNIRNNAHTRSMAACEEDTSGGYLLHVKGIPPNTAAFVKIVSNCI